MFWFLRAKVLKAVLTVFLVFANELTTDKYKRRKQFAYHAPSNMLSPWPPVARSLSEPCGPLLFAFLDGFLPLRFGKMPFFHLFSTSI